MLKRGFDLVLALFASLILLLPLLIVAILVLKLLQPLKKKKSVVMNCGHVLKLLAMLILIGSRM